MEFVSVSQCLSRRLNTTAASTDRALESGAAPAAGEECRRCARIGENGQAAKGGLAALTATPMTENLGITHAGRDQTGTSSTFKLMA
jgi:hypothetical protein